MKVIIAGSRDINDLRVLEDVIRRSGFESEITEVVCGGARGVDALGRKWAGNGNRIPVKMMNADWDGYGPAAGAIRNTEMAEYADALIALWDGKSPGTRHMIKTAKKLNLKVYYEIYYQENGGSLLNFVED
jgi:hypothetical protein